MTQDKLNETLRLHGLWLNGNDGGKRANLSKANLSFTNLSCTTLSKANMQGASLKGVDLLNTDLENANLRGANIDYSAWPLWCGSLSVKIDARIAAQLAYHVVRACQSVKDDADVVAFCNEPAVVKLANRFHRVEECGRIEAAEGGVKCERLGHDEEI